MVSLVVSKTFALPAYLPDQSPASGALVRAQNVYAAVDGYRPIGQFQSVSDALTEPFQGGASFISTDGSAFLLAGTASDLYRLDAGSWTSLIDSLSAGRWHFAQFGNYALGVNGSTSQVVDLAAGTGGEWTGAPTGTSITVVGDFVVIGGADSDILMVKWSAFNDHTGWTPAVDQSGFQPMLTGGAVMGLGGGEYGVILQRQRIVRMERTGDATAPFAFSEITPNVGCASKGSIAQAGRSIFFLSDRGFMALDDGQTLKPIGNEKVDRAFQAAVSRDDYELLYAAVDPRNTLVMWVMPGSPGTAWVYNWVLDRWTILEAPMSGVFSGFTSSLTLEALSAIYDDIDTMPYSLDDPRFSGGAPRLYFVDSGGRLGTFAGPALEARISTGFIEVADGRRARLRSVEPVADFDRGATLEIDGRARLKDAQNLKDTSVLRQSGIMPIRHSGQFMAFDFTISAGTDWSYFQSFKAEYEVGGER